ncbi:fructosamine kinase family protein [Enterococcus hirae]|nr:fructosamine kinase family protein [Enterococcus hirae]EMF0148658.1 fructosamine kinase family protein [Enterococcus hirae]EMF0191828.1 fructosamine kinase family protein [Enterococcus hirae]EMF0240450.1 fructosamine kinase family protein [Enterococcus hirae]EMF0246465.1 fructosamine kinase family protein [Enterococcus hirae]
MNIQSVLAEIQLEGKVIPITGGDVNQTYRIEEQNKSYFLKLHPNIGKSFFEAEVDGLKELAPYVRVPETYMLGEQKDGAYLLMEWIEPGKGDQKDLAVSLAKLHKVTAPQFGYRKDNYLGTVPQFNHVEEDWWLFFFKNRLESQIALAKKNNHWNQNRQETFISFKQYVLENFSDKKIVPSLLHGDLWSGNVFFDQQGEPVFVDPAVSYGDREQDIAMSQLFGGFRPEFLQSYQMVYPLEKNWEKRLPIYQLYYLLAHLNMFGESYGSQVDQLLAKR